MPFLRNRGNVSNPPARAYPKTLENIGDHLRKRRLDYKLLQKDIAFKLGIDTMTVCNGEKGKTRPALRFVPKIMELLGYDPLSNEATSLGQKIKSYRRSKGLSLKKLAGILGIDPTTLARWEKGMSLRTAKIKSRIESFIACAK